MTTAHAPRDVRALIKQGLEHPSLLDRIGDDDDFAEAGIGSGEVIRIALSLEEELARPLGDEELLGLSSVNAVAALLAAKEAV
ncbi:acyl carrier protein [Streptomyces sp. NA04227]|uniref:acyl carrier protein n=1 Tax=Streptomyces sp. NA04227 TaxID=2742136 RepID=UPI0015924F0A|nr:acyl carrier protein [Streptomyces sp. NA04227]QKW07765.1 acyl carrier protein [Streptomyces sp. NA04227]